MKNHQFTPWRLVSYYLITVLVLVSMGCSSRLPSSTDPSLVSSGTGSEQTTITFAASGYLRQYFESLMETFHEQNPDISVQFVDLNQSFTDGEEWNPSTYFRNLAQAADTFLLQGPFILDLNTDMSRYFRDLQPLYESDPSFQPDDFWPGILTACEDAYNNMVGLPLIATVNGIFYDKDAFDAAGLPYPKPGWTWDEFQKAVTALADKKGRQIKYGFYDQLDLGGSILAPVVSDYLVSHDGEVDVAGLLKEIQWYIDLGQAGMLSGVKTGEELGNAWDERWQLFEDAAFRPAMWIDPLISFVPTDDMAIDENNPFSNTAIDQFGFAPYPVSANGSSMQTSRSWTECAAMSAGSANPRAAWAWLNFLSRHWFVVDKTQVYELGRAPSRQSVAELDGYWDLLPAEAVPTVRYALEHGSYDFTYVGQFGEINLALAKTISENADFEEVLNTAIAARPITPTPPADTAPIVVATPRAPLPEGVTAIKYFINEYDQNELNAMKALVEQFNQRSPETQVSLNIDFSGLPEEDWYSSIAINFDCFTAGQYGFDTTQLLNLNPLLSNEPASFVDDFFPEMMAEFQKEGNQYALPVSSRLHMIAYNADLLARRGLPIPANDWTFEDFVELASAVASTSDIDPSYGYLFSPFDDFISLGKGIKWVDIESNPPQVYFDSPATQEYLKWLLNLEQERVLFNLESDWEKMNTIMISGQMAFWNAMMGEKTWWLQGSGQAPSFKIGMAPIPQISGDNPRTSQSYNRGHYISAQNKDPRACWEWIKFMSEQPNLFSGVPARHSIVESPAWEASVGREDAAAYRAAIANLKPPQTVDIENEMQIILWTITDWRNQAIVATLAGQEIPQVLFAQQQKAEAYLACTLALDSSKPIDELGEEMITCRQQVDPEGSN